MSRVINQSWETVEGAFTERSFSLQCLPGASVGTESARPLVGWTDCIWGTSASCLVFALAVLLLMLQRSITGLCLWCPWASGPNGFSVQALLRERALHWGGRLQDSGPSLLFLPFPALPAETSDCGLFVALTTATELGPVLVVMAVTPRFSSTSGRGCLVPSWGLPSRPWSQDGHSKYMACWRERCCPLTGVPWLVSSCWCPLSGRGLAVTYHATACLVCGVS